jgi:hypothetical protein
MPKGRGSRKRGSDHGEDLRRKRKLRNWIVGEAELREHDFTASEIRREGNLRVGLHASD